MVKKLARYRAKRDFKKTAEPSGTARIRAAEYPRFVIQKHDATRLHYDLRLEVDGVLKSWAVTRGPSLDPHEKRLAVEVEDHPLEYGDFEGTIPKGQYGGGTVMVWDRGFWLPDGQTSAADALREGELKFILAGEKLKGGWVLVRMKRDREGGSRTNWLLIKHRDEYVRRAAVGLPDDDRSVASGRSMAQIAAGKGRKPRPFIHGDGKLARPDAVWNSVPRKQARALRPVVREDSRSASLPNRRKAARAPMPQFIAPQLCKAVAHPSSGDRWGHEIKLDGYRLQLRIEHGVAELRTRKGLNWTEKFGAIAETAKKLPDCIIDGEVVALRRDGVTDFSSLQAALADGRTEELVFLAFDLLYLSGDDMRRRPLIQRKQTLRDLLEKHLPKGRHIRYVDHVKGEGDAVLESARRMGLEGIVSKRLDAPYTSGRSEAWTKAKCRVGHEVVIGGWSGGPDLLRSLIAGVYRGSRLAHVGRVGTGFDAATSADLLKRLNALATRDSPFSGEGAPRKERDVTWVKPQLVAEVTFGGWTDAGMVRQAAFKGLREDKPAREVRAAPAEVDVAPLASKPQTVSRRRSQMAAGQDASVLGVSISNPDKELWPAHADAKAVTKLDLAHYLEDVAPWLIEHIKGRPCSIIRAPDGIDGQTFFQRHAMPGISKHVALADISGDRKPYLQIDRVEGLIAMGQIAALEFHPWNCAPQRPEVPGRLIFDLDPAPDVAFHAVIAAAKELRDRLERLGLVAFCKTTGGKGLHVVVPLATRGKTGLGWKEAKAFAQAVASAMAADSPDRYLTKMTKKLRTGRIFLDYLRNDRMATAVAPLSPRARPGAPVSMPLNWSQVRDGLEPMRYTVSSVPKMLARSRAWKDYAEAARPLEAAARRFVDGKR